MVLVRYGYFCIPWLYADLSRRGAIADKASVKKFVLLRSTVIRRILLLG